MKLLKKIINSFWESYMLYAELEYKQYEYRTIMKNYLKKIKAFGKRAIKSYWNGFVEMAALQYMPYEYKNIKN